ncbi:MAG TPA: hypothetical protein VE981_11640 [Planctomycetota bacterium]|nr:hypothetical protein [Planctomycetota bacterium]
MIWLLLILCSVAAGWLLGRGDAAANAAVAASIAPETLLIGLMGVTVGLFSRDRIRLRRTYASPTLAYLGKGILFASLSAAATFLLSPVSWSPSCLFLVSAGAAAGTGTWLGNLPSRL